MGFFRESNSDKIADYIRDCETYIDLIMREGSTTAKNYDIEFYCKALKEILSNLKKIV